MRDYDPTTGRYIQADPLGLVDGASIYGYALHNPGRYVDPRGLAIDDPLPRNRTLDDLFCEYFPSSGACQCHGSGISVAPNLPNPPLPFPPLPQISQSTGDDEIDKAIDEIDSGKDRPNVKNPRPFENDGRDGSEELPETDANGQPIDYTEHYVNPRPAGGTRDGKRIVTGSDGSIWATGDHYGSFTKVK